MSQLTYLQAVNKVLVNLRENTVSATLGNGYAQLIGELVNSAKEKVEDSWRWHSLITTATFTILTGGQGTGMFSPGGMTNYSGTNTNSRSTLMYDQDGLAGVFDVTVANQAFRMTEITRENKIALSILNTASGQDPQYAFSIVRNNNGLSFQLPYPTLSNRNYTARLFIPQEPLDTTSDSTIIQVAAWRPIVSYATWMALKERGEELGSTADVWLQAYQDELARAISQDTAGAGGEYFIMQPD